MRTIKGHKLSTLTDMYIANILPHGSGINSTWKVTLKKDKVSCHNTYDYMDENGFYDAYIDFSVVFTPNDYKIHFHNLTRKGYRFVDEIGLRSYLEDCFIEAYEKVSAEMEWE